MLKFAMEYYPAAAVDVVGVVVLRQAE